MAQPTQQLQYTIRYVGHNLHSGTRRVGRAIPDRKLPYESAVEVLKGAATAIFQLVDIEHVDKDMLLLSLEGTVYDIFTDLHNLLVYYKDGAS